MISAEMLASMWAYDWAARLGIETAGVRVDGKAVGKVALTVAAMGF